LADNEDYKGLLEIANTKIAEYEPKILAQKERDDARKTALLDQLGDDADKFKGLDVPALEAIVELKTKSTNPPKEPGPPGSTPQGKFGGFESLDDLAKAAARGVPGARDEYNRIRGGV